MPTLLWLAALFSLAQTKAPAREVSFEREVLPVLRQCQGCHGARQQMNGLRLDSRRAALAGGYSGPAIVPGDSSRSKLIALVSGTGKTVMPPVGPRLKPEQVDALRSWIDQGAKWPESAVESKAAPAKQQHWSFVAPVKREPPAVRNRQWVRNPVDAFILARLESEGIQPAPEAARSTLIRRVSLDLTGLPPSLEEVREFLADERPDAYERLVDRLLASPHYGEKWARQWLDAARYADSDGYEKDLPRPYAWRWRNWVIEALNRDLPFDQFTVQQIAGDLISGGNVEHKVATGFHRNALVNREGGIDREQLRVEQVVDRTATVGSVWLGLTVGCAQCHDHKYDPISQKDFYSLAAFFNSVDEVDIDAPMPGEIGPYLQMHAGCAQKRQELLDQYNIAPLQAAWEPKVIEASKHQGKFGGDWDLAWTVLWNDERQILLKEPAQRTEKERNKLTDHFLEWYSAVVSKERYEELKFKELRNKLKQLDDGCPSLTQAQTIAELPQRRSTHVLLRGDFRSPGIEVEPNTPASLPPLTGNTPGSRLSLARWIVSRENPLTSRVAVNRMWQSFFGRGLVSTPADFGTQGERPTHPELLDWLAVEFMNRGWGVKQMHKLIVTSSAYRQSSSARKELTDKDPYNLLVARQSRLRLDAEIVRDAALASSGLLYPVIGGPSIRPPQPAGLTNLGYGDFVKWEESKGSDGYRRGLYIFFQRTVPYPMLMNFDSPDSNVTCARRIRSTTPLQSLNLLNDPVFFEAAQALAARVLRDAGPRSGERIEHAFLLSLARPPAPREAEHALTYLHRQTEILKQEPDSVAKLAPAGLEKVEPLEAAAWVMLSRGLLNLDEFITRE
jgi:mono/diheme cytochrome c family protein